MNDAAPLDRHELAYGDPQFDDFVRFYERIYVEEFPDPDERESIENIRAYLELKRQGWYGANNYHVLVLRKAGEIVAASLSDYLSLPNAGVIEFLVVAPKHRAQGLGRLLHDWTSEILDLDARRAGREQLDLIVAEMNDPFLTTTGDSMNPFERAEIWGAWGYGKLQFPYVQPPLDDGKGRVDNLLLMARCSPGGELVPGARIMLVVGEYMRWAMRIDDPTHHPDYLEMASWIEQNPEVRWIPLREYVGMPPERPLVTQEVRWSRDARFDEVMGVYERAFPPGPTSLGRSGFAALLDAQSEGSAEYHLWSLHLAAEEPPEGMVSFFSMPHAGFVGYAAFEGRLRRTGRFPDLVARVERVLLRDSPGARGLYGECEFGSEALTRVKRAGFMELGIDYRQPLLFPDIAPGVGGHRLALVYKQVGRHCSATKLSAAEFLADLRDILHTVYHLEPDAAENWLRRLRKAPPPVAEDRLSIPGVLL